MRKLNDRTHFRNLKKSNDMENLYQIITDKFIEALKHGYIPWKQPWTGKSAGPRGFGQNYGYSLLNQMLVEVQAEDRYRATMARPEMEALVAKICSGRFLTFQKVQEIGAKINRGAKSYMVTFFKFYQPKDKDGNPATITDSKGEVVPRMIPMLRYYRVFSEFDCTGIPAESEEEREVLNPVERAEEVIRNYTERSQMVYIVKESNRAYYSVNSDCVVVPSLEQYSDVAEFYSTAYHELVHSTGHPSRLNRLKCTFLETKEEYSREELVAEMGSAMSLSRLGIATAKTFRNSTAYLQSWLKALQNDNKMIFWASSRAEAAVKFIFNEEGVN